MELKLTTATGKASTKTVELADDVFDKPFNETLIHQVVTAYLAGARAGTRGQKTRSQVRGGGAKPFRQKGSGRARAGTIRSPLWRGGGKVFAAKPQDYTQKLNRKMYRGAVRSILSELLRQERLIVVDAFSVDSPKTKEAVEKLAKLGLSKVLIVADEIDENVYLSTRNIPYVNVTDVVALDPVSLVGNDKILMTLAAVKQLEEKLA